MAAKLQIDVVANTGKAKAELKSLGDAAAGIEKNLKAKTVGGAFDRLAASANAAKKALPTAGDAAGLTAVAAATTRAGTAATVANARFAALATTLKGIGASIVAGLSSAAAAVASIGASIGRALGTAILIGLRAAAIGAGIAAIVGTGFALAYAGALKWAQKMGADFNKTLAAAMKGGTTDTQSFVQFETLGAALTKSAEGGKQFAAAMLDMQKTLREGGDDAVNLVKALKEINIDPAKLSSKNLSVAVGEWEQLAAVFKTLTPERQANMMNKLFSSMDPEKLAQLTQTFQQASPAIANMLNQVEALNQQNQQAAKQNQAAGSAYQANIDALTRLATAMDNLLGITRAYNALAATMTQALQAIAPVIDSAAQKVEEFTRVWQSMSWGDVAAAMKTGISQAFDGAKQAVEQKLDEIKTAITNKISEWANAIAGMVGEIKAAAAKLGQAIYDGILDALKGLGDAIANLVRSAITKVIGTIGSLLPGAPSGRSPAIHPLYDSPAFAGLAPGSRMPQIVGAGARILSPIAGLAAGSSFKAFDSFFGNVSGIQASTKALQDNTNAKIANKDATDALTKASDIYKMSTEQLITFLNLQTSSSTQAALEVAKLSAAMASGKLSAEGNRVAMEKLAAAQQKFGTSGLGKAAEDFNQGLKSWGDSAASSLANAIVEGEDLEEVLKNLVKQLAAMALQTLVLKPLFNSLFGAMGVGGAAPIAANDSIAGFAAGAAAQASNAIVAAGRIASRAASSAGASGGTLTMGDVVINFASQGPPVQSDDQQAAAFGVRVRAIIQRELVAQQRPGGILRQAG